jgi:dipeptidyl aminopeptidase/acylaminoacyl peptidase
MMKEPIIAPYGSWKSPITPDVMLSDSIMIGGFNFSGNSIFWTEVRPREQGRAVIVQRDNNGVIRDITPPPFNVRTRVHEYGGLSFAVGSQGDIFFSNFSDQRLYRQRPGSDPISLTPNKDVRYADHQIDSVRNRLICVMEDHTQPGEAVNSIANLQLEDGGGLMTLASGRNFYSDPRLSTDGKRLAWLCWDHPNMPWDGCELWVGELSPQGEVVNALNICGGQSESIFQPEWSPDGTIYFVSDRTGWWNLYRFKNGVVEPLLPMEAEFGSPAWVFGLSLYGFISADEILCAFEQNGQSKLARLNVNSKELSLLSIPFDNIFRVRVSGNHALLLAGSPRDHIALVHLDLISGGIDKVKSTSELQIDPGYLSMPEMIAFSTKNGLTAHGYFYPPRNQDYQAPAGEKPPLLVLSHGGPTDRASTSLRLRVQYWTSRGIAVLDVNYGGSTGYGRAYRERLKGQWGIVDVDDCVNGALYLVRRGDVDGNRLAISGGSAGGYTTLCALTFRQVFKAGASHFGIGDLETMAKDTHKFESRYLDSLIGPYPQRADLYYNRSPIHFLDRLNCPMILFQGLEDQVVPPNQAESMFAAVRSKGLPVAYLPFEGEQHGFRKAENIKRTLEAELYFYSRIFKFELADPVEPVQIVNL